MIQINLVPDIKQEMLRAQRMRNTAISTSIIVGVGAVVAVGVLGVVLTAQVGVQKLQESSVASGFKELQSHENLNNALTVQHQLGVAASLHAERSMSSRLLDVIAAINPPAPDDVKISRVSIDPTTSVLTLEGSAAGGYPSTEVFKKTVDNTTVTYLEDEATEAQEVPLTTDAQFIETSYGADESGAKVVRFTMTFTYPEGMLSNKMRNVQIKTPNGRIDVTDSKTRIPDSMFSQAAKDLEEDN